MSNSDLEKADFTGTVERLRVLRQPFTAAREREDVAGEEDLRLEVLKSWGVPRRERESLGRLVSREVLLHVKRWSKAPRDGWCLVLGGPVGTGKSTAAAWWLWRTSRGESRVSNPRRRWWTAAQLMRADGYGDTIDNIVSVRDLVLDDIGAEYSDVHGALMTKLDAVLDERYGNYRRTLICTNLNSATFRERYGDRVADRINEATKHGGGFWEYSGPSMRGM